MSHQPPQQAPPGLPEILAEIYSNVSVLKFYLSIILQATDSINTDLYRLTSTISQHDFECFLRNNS